MIKIMMCIRDSHNSATKNWKSLWLQFYFPINPQWQILASICLFVKRKPMRCLSLFIYEVRMAISVEISTDVLSSSTKRCGWQLNSKNNFYSLRVNFGITLRLRQTDVYKTKRIRNCFNSKLTNFEMTFIS